MLTQTVRLIKPWLLHPKGKLLTLNGGVAGELIRSGRAEAVQPEPEPPKATGPLKRKKRRNAYR